MGRHRFDPVAIVVGVMFVTAAIIVLSGGRLIDEGRILLPVGLVAFGVALLVQAAPTRPSPTPGAAAPPTTYPDIGPAGTTAPRAEETDAWAAEPDPPQPPETADAEAADAGEPPARSDDAGGAERPGADFYFGGGWQPGPDDDRPPRGDGEP